MFATAIPLNGGFIDPNDGEDNKMKDNFSKLKNIFNMNKVPKDKQIELEKSFREFQEQEMSGAILKAGIDSIDQSVLPNSN